MPVKISNLTLYPGSASMKEDEEVKFVGKRKLKAIDRGLTTGLSLVGFFAIGLVIWSLVMKNQGVLGAGFDQFGYNYQARLFNGAADGVDRTLDGKVWGDPRYGKDHLVMKWSKAWDDARFNGAPWTGEAWEDNEWNGKVPGGSGEVWHYKIVWVGPTLQASPLWKPGGYPIWGQFEVIFSQGTAANLHSWETHATPSGYGMMK